MRKLSLPLIAVLCLTVSPALAEMPLTVGEEFPTWITADAPSRALPTETGSVWEVHHPGATYVALHFRELDLAPGDRVVISDPAGHQAVEHTGRGRMNAGTFWARHIKGDTAVLQLVRAEASRQSSFVVDRYAAGFVDLGSPFEAICGSDDKENAVCYASSHSAEYDTSRAVARLLIGGTSMCTGWLVSADNYLITNEHCISTDNDALNTDYEFMAEAPNCNDSNCQLCYQGDVYTGGNLLRDNAALDYALIQITSGDPAATYGWLEIDNREAVPGEQIYIPQHPGGRAKELGIYSSASADASGVCTVFSASESPCSGSGYYDVGYYCDTEGGSSGSPVLATSSHKVIALHHCALCPNRGVPINLVYADIDDLLGSCGDGTCSGTEDPCSCPSDCGSPPSSETSCSDGVDNDCDDLVDCDDADCTGSADCVCDFDGTCELGEDCLNCANDCISGSGGATCGNGICEAGDGEDCTSCPSDCAGLTTGKPSGRYCCGSDTPCSDSRCTSGGLQCTDSSSGSASYCCGDGICEGAEDSSNCALDCGSAGYCGDGTCDPGEDECSCSSDCGFPPSSEAGLCTDGIDNDCDGSADCADADCDTDPACTTTCAGYDEPCVVDDDCCSLNCGGPPGRRTCKK